MAKEAKRTFTYEPRGKDAVKERANMRGGNFDSFILPKYKKYKIKEGKNRIRVLPPTWEKPKHYGMDLWVNYDIGVDNQSYLSLSKMKGERDPLDEARRAAQREGDEKLAKALNPRQRILMWIVDRMNEDEGPQLFDAPFTLDKSFANISIDPETNDVVYIDDPESGCDVTFFKEGTGLLTKYDASKMRLGKPGYLHEDEGVQADWLEYVQENPVPGCLQYYDYDHIASSFSGHAGTRDDEDVDVPKRRGRSSSGEDDPPPRNTGPKRDGGRSEEVAQRQPITRRPAGNGEDSDQDDRVAARPSRARTTVVPQDEDEEAAPPPRGESIRDRLARRRVPPSTKLDTDAEVGEDD